jgi:NADH-quinone oxidoreductase subunit C
MTGNTAATQAAEGLEELVEHVGSALGDRLADIRVVHGQLQLVTTPEHVLEVLKFLRDDPACRFVCFTDLCGVDWPEREKRFEVVYHLLSPYINARVRIKVPVGEGESVPSCIDIFPGADWFEREAYDMYGIFFAGHPDLRRILTDYGFQGHPLRKDFPVTGFVEVRYDEDRKRVVYEPVNLQQAWREFDNLSPWRGDTGWRPAGGGPLPGDEKADGQNDG